MLAACPGEVKATVAVVVLAGAMSAREGSGIDSRRKSHRSFGRI